ncbi:hypothetical protein LSCM1_04953 [Leishmania martiniquensis]|uniref:Uncharacterized protein n=1 Tax=Leishmania martiniquensis TaxID=1580590 RepID=A0A836H4W9_9TRYP|nr:hypothetical protein LSCM1_04953 [Leishmania martiniquensis]
MIRRVALLRFTSDRVHDDRQALARHHLKLLDKRHWELTTPSRALPVVEVLLRSGVLMDKLEKCSTKPLVSLSPSMTRKERSLVHKLSHMLQQTSLPSASSLAGNVTEEDEAIQSAYSSACATGACTVDLLVDVHFVRRLRSPSSALMLLELAGSRCAQVRWAGGKPSLSREMLDSICDLLAQHERSLDVRATQKLLSMLGSGAQLHEFQLATPAGKRLFRLCVRRIHDLLPDLRGEDLLVAYLLLERSEGYARPFIVLGEMEKLLLSTALEHYAGVSSSILLRFMTTPFAVRHIDLNLRLCAGWSPSSRITDFTLEECLAAFTIVAALHEGCSAESAAAVAPLRHWETLHDALFAKVYFVALDMSAADCFRILDQSEVINVSGWGITVPQMLLEKLKKRILSECTSCAMDDCRAPGEAEPLLQIALALQALMQRYTVLPSNAADEYAVAQCIFLLERCISLCPPHG